MNASCEHLVSNYVAITWDNGPSTMAMVDVTFECHGQIQLPFSFEIFTSHPHATPDQTGGLRASPQLGYG